MDKQITSKELREVLGGISDMSLWRFLHDPYLKFPKPTYIKRRRFWSKNELEAWFHSLPKSHQENYKND